MEIITVPHIQEILDPVIGRRLDIDITYIVKDLVETHRVDMLCQVVDYGIRLVLPIHQYIQ